VVIVGFDPGLATLGYGVIEVNNNSVKMLDYGAVITPKEDSLPLRLEKIEKGVKYILEKFKPEEIAVEELFFVKNITNGIAVAHARGVLLLTATKYCDKLFEYTPLQIKQALTGYGRAEKRQIQEMVKTYLKLEKIPRPDDAADALAVALTHSQTRKFGNFFKLK
jgi:crossover junction endodeoxyribonuclease RuvC